MKLTEKQLRKMVRETLLEQQQQQQQPSPPPQQPQTQAGQQFAQRALKPTADAAGQQINNVKKVEDVLRSVIGKLNVPPDVVVQAIRNLVRAAQADKGSVATAKTPVQAQQPAPAPGTPTPSPAQPQQQPVTEDLDEQNGDVSKGAGVHTPGTRLAESRKKVAHATRRVKYPFQSKEDEPKWRRPVRLKGDGWEADGISFGSGGEFYEFAGGDVVEFVNPKTKEVERSKIHIDHAEPNSRHSLADKGGRGEASPAYVQVGSKPMVHVLDLPMMRVLQSRS